jgi:hypothetical protein
MEEFRSRRCSDGRSGLYGISGNFRTNKLVRLSGRADLAEMVVAAGTRESAPLKPIHRGPKASPPAGNEVDYRQLFWH